MVSSGSQFLIDATFIVERVHKAFYGSPLLLVSGQDRTFTYGCMRDFLRWRRALGIKAGMIVFGSETYSIVGRENVLDIVAILKEFKIPNVNDSHNSCLDLAGNMRSALTYIVTADRRFLQFCTSDHFVVLPKGSKQIEWDCMSSEKTLKPSWE